MSNELGNSYTQFYVARSYRLRVPKDSFHSTLLLPQQTNYHMLDFEQIPC